MPGQEEPRYYSLIEPLRESSSPCGYCHSKSDSSHTYGVWAHDLSPQVYQMMMDRGWRRSGSYLYLPDRRTTCCPPYTIRCSASGFQASRGQRQAAYRWRKFIEGATEHSGAPKQQKPQSTFDLCQVLNFDDAQGTPPTIKEHEFQIRIEPAAFTEEKFKLYKKYQIEVHNDQAEEVTKKSFESFLCTNPFRSDRSVAKHACWLVDDQLIAFSVIDILTLGISSVYLVWDTDYAKYGLGRLASLQEIAWIQEWGASKLGEQFDWYYLGFYIHSCPKMTYKAEYSPSFLLDPSALDWWPLEDCIPILDASESNVTSFASSDVNQEGKKSDRADFSVKILTQTGAIETVKSSDPRVKEVVEKVGAEIVRLSLICI
ncbi:uncharacterized protein PGTG_10150 [Puccinia graminis f. sp. tritici CRL 75-36-700-3]|uniref:Arginyl-tRNA--protein transferase 1 n=1 Tax=Puccinia graminis f. sp. tritici (strain CRL 75-36-700-3 / race SCCL) TaxID=418459 RepID=E3KJF5_PUCGT|nr:uncharacterized protein PGTG_10150 [Puccinia graminis f. sp. tritici CRL 75-36-700-3]EFP84430.2 hypothetical protein PGTG_10150 [Puccinia graminis f. sp. tritici CRL 75-36-700-3]